MTQRPPRQSDQPHDESVHRVSACSTEAEQDERIGAAIRRLFPPPTVWPAMFHGTHAQHQSADNGGIANGQAEAMHDQPTAKRTESSGVEEAADSTPSDRRTRRAAWMRRMGVAACLMLGLFGVWNTWNHLNLPQFRSYQPPPLIEVGHVYREFVEDGFLPTNDQTVDASGHWMVPDTPMRIRLNDAEALDMGIERLGTHRYDDVHVGSPMLLFRVEGQPVVLFTGSIGYEYVARSTCSEHLHMHHRQVGQFNVYELTPHRSPILLGYVECDRLGCESEHRPTCATDVAP